MLRYKEGETLAEAMHNLYYRLVGDIKPGSRCSKEQEEGKRLYVTAVKEAMKQMLEVHDRL